MTRTPFALVLGAAAALAGCNQQDITLNTGQDGDRAATNAPVELPPSIAHSKIYRCKDNSVVYIDWLSDNLSANVRSERTGPATHVMAPAAGEPMVAEGYSLTGAATDPSVTLTRPDKGSQSCKA